jgi:hypothetical protein
MPNVSDSIVVATTVGEDDAFAALIREYWDWLLTRYAEHPGLMQGIGTHQGLEGELNAVAIVYGPPEGRRCWPYETARSAVQSPTKICTMAHAR